MRSLRLLITNGEHPRKSCGATLARVLAPPGAMLLAAILATGAAATEGIYSNDCVPPPDTYIGHFHAEYLQGLIDLSEPQHFRFTECDSLPGATALAAASSTHTFGSLIRVDVSVSGGTPQTMQAPATVTVRVDYTGVDGAGKRMFDTEMLQLDIAGGTLPPGTRIRESPTMASTGKTTVRDYGGGLFAIDSFFDIFTELSLDDGQTWNPAESGASHMELLPSLATPVRRSTWGKLKMLYR